MSSDRENKTLREDILFVAGRVLWRLAQVALVGAGVIVLFNVISTGAGDTREEKYYVATVKSGLQNLVAEQETYFAENGRYHPSNFRTGDGSDVIVEATATGWRATVTHRRIRYLCGVFGGDMAPPREGAAPGTPVCWKP